jgi:hypothetical protein
MKLLVEQINRVLADWNPLEVPSHIASEEYKGYIPSILRSIQSKEQLLICLEDILNNKLGIEYDSKNKTHSADLQNVSNKLIEVYKQLQKG